MTEYEQGFLAAVCAGGLDELPKLVYADWLGERTRVDEEDFWRWAAGAGVEPEPTYNRVFDKTYDKPADRHDWNSPKFITQHRGGWDMPGAAAATLDQELYDEVVKAADVPPYDADTGEVYCRFTTKAVAWLALRDAWVRLRDNPNKSPTIDLGV
jgi:uncharacterized protein (TIGR02996 family)